MRTRTIDRIPSKRVADRITNPITKHIILNWEVPKGTKPHQLTPYDKHLLSLIEHEKIRIAYQRKELLKSKN